MDPSTGSVRAVFVIPDTILNHYTKFDVTSETGHAYLCHPAERKTPGALPNYIANFGNNLDGNGGHLRLRGCEGLFPLGT